MLDQHKMNFICYWSCPLGKDFLAIIGAKPEALVEGQCLGMIQGASID